MSLYQEVKKISCNDAAQYLGLKGKRTSADRGMWCCPFHEDKNPSMACFDRDNRFYCFSCHARGDAADLFAKVGQMSLTEAARSALYVFGHKVPLGQQYHVPAGCDRPQGKAALVRHDLVERIARLVRYDFRMGMVTLLKGQAAGMTSAMETLEDAEGWLWAHALQRACRVQEDALRWEQMTDEDVLGEIREKLDAGAVGQWGEGLPTPGRTVFRAILDDLERTGRCPKLNLMELEECLDILTRSTAKDRPPEEPA